MPRQKDNSKTREATDLRPNYQHFLFSVSGLIPNRAAGYRYPAENAESRFGKSLLASTVVLIIMQKQKFS